MQIRFQKLDEKGQVVPNEWVWYDTDKVENQDTRAAIDVAIQKQNIVAVNVEALSSLEHILRMVSNRNLFKLMQK
jgi:hypothetical protein